jgi:uracil-DNA glycosylase family 4
MKTQIFYPEIRFKDFINSVQYCDLCPRMNHRIKVLSDLNGNIHSNVLFIAEAPGRLGADKTGIPLFGDKTGNNFEKLISSINWKREEIFITNAILCNPREESGNNGTPHSTEIANCSYYLRMTIELIKPQIIITLGRIALDALNSIFPHNFTLSKSVGQIHDWNGYKIVPLYHPAPRALVHRSFQKQLEDFQTIAAFINKTSRKEIENVVIHKQPEFTFLEESYTKFEEVVFTILEHLTQLTLFKLNKLLYMLDYQSIKVYGYSITKEVYLRELNGPWLPNLTKTLEKYEKSKIETFFKSRIPIVRLKDIPKIDIKLSKEEIDLLESIISKYADMNEKVLKSNVYLTDPMRYILKEEKKGKKMPHSAVIYKDKTILDHTKETITE